MQGAEWRCRQLFQQPCSAALHTSPRLCENKHCGRNCAFHPESSTAGCQEVPPAFSSSTVLIFWRIAPAEVMSLTVISLSPDEPSHRLAWNCTPPIHQVCGQSLCFGVPPLQASPNLPLSLYCTPHPSHKSCHPPPAGYAHCLPQPSSHKQPQTCFSQLLHRTQE